MPASRSAFAPDVRRALPALVVVRFVLNTSARMVFTFLPAISRGTGLSTQALGNVIFARDMTGLLGPATGRFARRVGSWRTMVIAGVCASIGMLLLPLGTAGVVVGFVLWGLCRTAFLVSMNSWIGDVVAYERRSRASGMIELTWAAAPLIGLPIIGVLIDEVGWWAAPTILGLLGLPFSLLMHRTGTSASSAQVQSAVSGRVSMSPNTLAALVGLALLTGAAQFLLFIHGQWLEETYDFDASQVGFALVAVGIAEAIASYGTSRVTDGLGKRNAVIAGTFVLGVGLVGLAIAPAPPLALGLGLLVLAFLGFEFAIVSSIPLVSELDPGARSHVVGRSVGLTTITRATVSLATPRLYDSLGFRSTMIAGTIAAVGAIVTMAALVKEP